MTTLITFINKNGEQVLQVPKERTLAGVITTLFNNHKDDESFVIWAVEIVTEDGTKWSV